jgi:hypothetical protein
MLRGWPTDKPIRVQSSSMTIGGLFLGWMIRAAKKVASHRN